MSVGHFFTQCLCLIIADLTIDDKWEICRQFSNHYSWVDDVPKSAQSGISKNKSKQSVKSKSRSSKSTRTPNNKLSLTPMYYLIGICRDLT